MIGVNVFLADKHREAIDEVITWILGYTTKLENLISTISKKYC